MMRSLTVALLSFGLAQPSLAAPKTRKVLVDGPTIQLSSLLGAVSKDVDLGPAAPAGRTRIISRGAILQRLRLRKAPASWPRQFRVVTRAQQLSCQKLQTLLARELGRTLRRGLSVKRVTCRQALVMPAGAIVARARLSTTQRQAGSLYAQLKLQVGGWPARRLIVPVFIDGQVPVLLAAKDLLAKQTLTRASVRIETRQASQLPSGVLMSLSELGQWEPASLIRSGEMLRKSLLKLRPLVRRGSRVTVSVRLPGVQVTIPGQVRQDGRKGDTVSVLCFNSRKLVRARVLSARRVQVDL
jgi:flagella basal body P-ring formation protein FlgA